MKQLFAFLSLCVSSLACTTVLYDGPAREPSDVATIVSGKNAELARIDGVRVRGGGNGRYVVLPGPHAIQVVGQRTENHFLANTIHKSGEMGSCFVAQPGRMYNVRAYLQDGYWSSEVFDEEAETNVDEGACAPSFVDGARERSQAVLANPPHPGNGFLLVLGVDVGGEDIVSATTTNGDSRTLSTGQGGLGAVGASFTPFWWGDRVGVGAASRIGVKYEMINAANGSVHLLRYPFSIWVHGDLRLSERWYLSVAGGAHKDLSPSLSGDGVAADFHADFQSPWGWLSEVGLIFAQTWHTAGGFSVRYTNMHYTVGGAQLDASNVGLALTLYMDP